MWGGWVWDGWARVFGKDTIYYLESIIMGIGLVVVRYVGSGCGAIWWVGGV